MVTKILIGIGVLFLVAVVVLVGGTVWAFKDYNKREEAAKEAAVAATQRAEDAGFPELVFEVRGNWPGTVYKADASLRSTDVERFRSAFLFALDEQDRLHTETDHYFRGAITGVVDGADVSFEVEYPVHYAVEDMKNFHAAVLDGFKAHSQGIDSLSVRRQSISVGTPGCELVEPGQPEIEQCIDRAVDAAMAVVEPTLAVPQDSQSSDPVYLTKVYVSFGPRLKYNPAAQDSTARQPSADVEVRDMTAQTSLTAEEIRSQLGANARENYAKKYDMHFGLTTPGSDSETAPSAEKWGTVWGG